MPQSKVITSDGDERADFKSRLNDKVDGLLNPEPAAALESRVLLLPVGHEAMAEAELLFTLTHNPELGHSGDSAVMAVNLLQGRAAKPANISFKVMSLANPVPVPEFVTEIPARRKSSGVAPGFARLKDSAPERQDKESFKKKQFKQSLADGIQRKLTEAPVLEKSETQVLLLPANYEDLSNADLHFALVNDPALKHSHDSALLTIDMINGRISPKGAVLQTVEGASALTAQPTRVVKAPPAKARAKDVATLQQVGEVRLLPANYRELSEGDLGFVLTHTPDLKYTPEAASSTLDVLFGRTDAHNMKFEVVQPQAVAMEAQPKPESPTDPVVLLLPANYRDFGATELHSVLLNTPALGHSVESASLAVSVITNAVLPPQGVELRLAELTVEHVMAEPMMTERRSADSSWIKTDLASLPTGADRVVILPRGFDAMTEQQLVFVLVNQVDKRLALDIIDVLKGKRGLSEDIELTVEE